MVSPLAAIVYSGPLAVNSEGLYLGKEFTEDERWAKIDQGQKIALRYWGI
jgi:hypothetical protein